MYFLAWPFFQNVYVVDIFSAKVVSFPVHIHQPLFQLKSTEKAVKVTFLISRQTENQKKFGHRKLWLSIRV
jgi:hypothetical protein